MTFASFLLGSVIALIFGSAFHFWRGGGLKWFVFYLIVSVFGFWIGNILSEIIKFHFLSLGPINLAGSILVCVAILLLGNWLSMASKELGKKGN